MQKCGFFHSRAPRLWTALLVSLCYPGLAYALDPQDARHLLSRTATPITPTNLRALAPLDRSQAYDWIVKDHALAKTATLTPAWLPEFEAFNAEYEKFRHGKTDVPHLKRTCQLGEVLKRKIDRDGLGYRRLDLALKAPEQLEFRLEKLVTLAGHNLHSRWLRHMLTTPSPFTETMTLFWHGHFTSAHAKVRQPRLMVQQNALLRTHALGSFRTLLHAVTFDGAMLSYLDGKDNVVGHPNQNYARELFEFFTLGIDRYTEEDVREAARALSGIRLVEQSGVFDPTLHDAGEKRILGVAKAFTPTQLLDHLLQQPRVSEHVVEKVWRHFISFTPDPVLVKAWSQDFRTSDFDVNALMRRVLTSDAFYAPGHRLALIKSPVEFTVGLHRQLGTKPRDYVRMAHQNRILGQVLFDPPDVRGWVGGTSWIKVASWPSRQSFVRNMLLRPAKKPARPHDVASDRELARWRSRFTPGTWQHEADAILLGPIEVPTEKAANTRAYLLHTLTRPEYALK